jgi:D-alanyl-D-alanine carboxypeptidase/D-alanyl-D-alanine-endopeptidase (penicillin-binding protein 4)
VAAVLVPAAARGAESWDSRVEAVLAAPGYRGAHWGLLVVEAKSGLVVYERNADQMFCPASVTKLFSTAAAMADLGADYRFQTPVVRRGEVANDGTLRGDLILVARGDLSLGGRAGTDGTLLFEDNDHIYAAGNFNSTLVASDPLAGLDHLARQVQDAGIKSVGGDVLVDDRLFESTPSSGSGPSRVSSIVVNDNLIDIVVSPGAAPGEPAMVRTVPATAYASVDAQVETIAEGEKPSLEVRSVGPRRFSVRGRLPVGHKEAVRFYEVDDPASFARALFIECLRRRGVRVPASPLGRNRDEALPAREAVGALPRVAEYTSPPFREYARVILKVSHNLHASTLPLLVASHHGETTLEAGMRRQGTILKELGVDVATIAFGGGAGGSRADLVTPRATIALLRAMAKRPDFSAYESALPVLGRDGTLAKAVAADSPARGHARAKTGTYWLEDAQSGKAVLTSKALAGYMESASGRDLVFAFFVNNVPLDAPAHEVSEATAAAGRLLGKLCEVFYADKADEAPQPARP